MNTAQLLRMCADKIEATEDWNRKNPETQLSSADMILHWPDGNGRFPFHGKGTETLSHNGLGYNYAVPVSTILKKLSKYV
jgi:hypothetical protein